MQTDSNNKKVIVIDTWKGCEKIFEDDILYITCDVQGINIYLNRTSCCESPYTLTLLIEMLDSVKFCQIHRGCIVNLMYVKEYNKFSNQVSLLQEDEPIYFTIARRRIKSFINAFKSFNNGNQ